MKTIKMLMAMIIAAMLIAPVFSQQTAKRFEKQITISYNYLMYLPKDYQKTKDKYPLLIFLHGSGERGSNIELVKKNGVPKLIEDGKDFPFIVVSPQCPDGSWWNSQVINEMLNTIIAENRVDESRIYITGLSMGGYGTWEMITTFPQRFAAAAPICGGGNPTLARFSHGTPVWAFHGGKDEVVPMKQSLDMIEVLQSVGDDVKLTVYPEAGHDSWTEAYNNPKLYEWFLSHKKK